MRKILGPISTYKICMGIIFVCNVTYLTQTFDHSLNVTKHDSTAMKCVGRNATALLDSNV